MTIEDEFIDVHDLPASRPYDQKLKERCKKLAKKGKSKTEFILEILQYQGPCMAKDFYTKMEITEGQLYYRLKKLTDQGLIYRQNNSYYLIEDPITPGEINCKNKPICKYFEQSKCYPEICKFYQE